jgi:CRISPR system Cascade subunit CasE
VSDNVDEVDVAAHRYARDASVSREQAYTQWLEKELARDQSAALQSARLVAVKRTRVLRRTQGQDRRWVAIEGPDIWFTGELVIDNPEAFSALLRRGIGRHRAFGFGCLLVAPSGVLG